MIKEFVEEYKLDLNAFGCRKGDNKVIFRKWRKPEEPCIIYGGRGNGKTYTVIKLIEKLMKDNRYLPCGIAEPALLLGEHAYMILCREVPLDIIEENEKRIHALYGTPIFVSRIKPYSIILGEKEEILQLLEHINNTNRLADEICRKMFVTSLLDAD